MQFNIRSASDFYEMVVCPQYEDFVQDNGNVRKAVCAIIVAYHLYDWVHGRKFTVDHFQKNYPSYTGLEDAFEIARRLANGAKHADTIEVDTRKQKGFSSGFSEGFARPHVVIKGGEEISVDSLLKKLMGFWQERAKAGWP